VPPTPVRIVPPTASGWAELRDVGTPILAPLGRAGMILIFTVFMLLKREDLRNRLLRLAGSIKTILNIVVVASVAVWVLRAVGLWGRVTNYRFVN
jgi:hypothetical protein